MKYWQIQIVLADNTKTYILVKAERYTEAVLHARSIYPFAKKVS